jgi:hypothetical protein
MAKAELYDYIEMLYNRTRRHSHLRGVSPDAFEAVSNELKGVRKSLGSPTRPTLIFPNNSQQ